MSECTFVYRHLDVGSMQHKEKFLKSPSTFHITSVTHVTCMRERVIRWSLKNGRGHMPSICVLFSLIYLQHYEGNNETFSLMRSSNDKSTAMVILHREFFIVFRFRALRVGPTSTPVSNFRRCCSFLFSFCSFLHIASCMVVVTKCHIIWTHKIT